MSKKILILLSSLLLPCVAFSLALNSNVQVSAGISNFGTEDISVTEANTPLLQNVLIPSGRKLTCNYPADKFTNASGQSFNHTVNIYSAKDQKLICTVTSHLTIGLNSLEEGQLTSSDPSKCDGSNTYTFSGNSNNPVYGFEVYVNRSPSDTENWW